jgi:hypothetical protein
MPWTVQAIQAQAGLVSHLLHREIAFQDHRVPVAKDIFAVFDPVPCSSTPHTWLDHVCHCGQLADLHASVRFLGRNDRRHLRTPLINGAAVSAVARTVFLGA